MRTKTIPRASVRLTVNETVTINDTLTWETTSKGESFGLDEGTFLYSQLRVVFTPCSVSGQNSRS